MLPERLQNLLTAYVDGELAARQRRAVDDLLRKSPEARTFLKRLQTDADALRALPVRGLEPDFSRRVLNAIAAAELKAPREVLVRFNRQPIALRPWYGLVVAASALIVLSLGTYGYLTVILKPTAPAYYPVAVKSSSDKPDSTSQNDDPAGAGQGSRVDTPTETQAANTRPERTTPLRVAEDPVVEAPPPEIGLGTPTRDKERFELFKPDLSLIVTLRELEQDKARTQLRDELVKDSSFRLEMFCLDNQRALDRLREVFKANGVRLLVDQTANARLKRGVRTNYVIYSEELGPDELATILKELGADKSNDAKRCFDQAVLSRLSSEDRKELSTLLGVDPNQMQPVKKKTPLGVDLRKPISEGTADQIVQMLNGKDAANGETKSAGKSERLALVLAYNPVHAVPAASKEVKLFLANRKDRRPGALQIVLVLRGASGS